MLNEILGKMNSNEKLIGLGAIVVAIAWIIGLGSYGVASGGSVGFLSLLCAAAAVVVIYLKYAPDTKINWPAPIPLILLILGGVCALGGLLVVLALMQWSWVGMPVTAWLAAIGILVGGAIMTYAAYMEYSKKPA